MGAFVSNTPIRISRKDRPGEYISIAPKLGAGAKADLQNKLLSIKMNGDDGERQSEMEFQYQAGLMSIALLEAGIVGWRLKAKPVTDEESAGESDAEADEESAGESDAEAEADDDFEVVSESERAPAFEVDGDGFVKFKPEYIKYFDLDDLLVDRALGELAKRNPFGAKKGAKNKSG